MTLTLSPETLAAVQAEFPQTERQQAAERLAVGQTVCTVTDSGVRRCLTPEGALVEKPPSFVLDPDEEG
jgi:hypothetical protein